MPSSVTPALRPFFERADVPASKRLLLISYHFPPSRAVGALRWQKLAAYAAKRGYGLDVLTLDPSSLTEHDADGLQELPLGVRIFGVPLPRSGVDRVVDGMLAARRWVKQQWRRTSTSTGSKASGSVSPRQDSFAWSELRTVPLSAEELARLYSSWLDYSTMGAWAQRVANAAVALASSTNYEAVITCGPPHMVHEAGRRVAQRTGLPLILDFRDPWSLVQRVPEVYASPLWLRYAKRYERAAIDSAALVIVNTEPHRTSLRRAYPELRAPIVTVTNGYDDEPLPASRRSSRFVIAYAGTVYLDRDPRPLFRAAARVIRERSLTPEQFALIFMGSGNSLGGVTLTDMARDEGIASYVELRPSAPRREALEFLAGASMLVSLPQDSDMAIPSKVFEYMRYDAWLLALASPGSATELLLRGSNADIAERNDIDAMARIIGRRYDEHVQGIVPAPIADDRRFSREQQANLLFDALTRELAARSAGAATMPSTASPRISVSASTQGQA
jgi:glycosyltransferase involved in cell wall biosynthesis